MNYLIFISLVLIQQFSSITSSEGDKSYFYQKCVDNCVKISCKKGDSSLFESSVVHDLDVWTKLLWNCKDDCRYKCMWRTVQGFQERGYKIPKFHGKWPFTRVLGVQEPGSALASLLNLASHAYMLHEIRRRFSARGAPFVHFWHVFAAVCINAWAWSTIFHTRDTPFTEFMDYACALSMVMALFVAAFVRAFYERVVMVFLMLMITLMYYTQHVQYLYDGVVRGSSIDYSYNMQVNIIFGVFGSLIWVSWAAVQYLRGARHAWLVGAFTLWSGAALALELGEWAPAWGLWDAHAVWHLATAPLPLLFYRFVIEDLYYMYPTKITEKSDYHKLT